MGLTVQESTLKYSRRRARSRRRGIVRFVGVAIRSIGFLTLIACSIAVVRWISSYQEGSGRANAYPTSAMTRAGFQPQAIQTRNRRVVYPYSVVPGGVTSAAELRESADHDSTVGDHYRGFDYSHARIVEVNAPRLVYLSYR